MKKETSDDSTLSGSYLMNKNILKNNLEEINKLSAIFYFKLIK